MKNKKRLFSVLVVFVLFLTSCGSEKAYRSSNFFSMDTLIEIRAYQYEKDVSYALASCKQIAESIEKKISTMLQESETYAFNHLSKQTFSKEFMEILSLSLSLSEYTNGYFDVSSGCLISLWEMCEKEQRLPAAEEIQAALDALGYQKIQFEDSSVIKKHPSLSLNFGAVGKGFAADKMAEALKENGVSCGMISFISSITVFGDKTFTIGIRCPNTSGELCGYLKMQNKSLSVSGDYERFYEIEGQRYSHILNPKTGEPSDNDLHSVVVVADSSAVADALSTAFSVMGIEKVAELYKKGEMAFEFLCITDTHVIVSDGLLDYFESATEDYIVVPLSEYVVV